MDQKLEQFLKSVEGYLKNMPISERIDVIKELKSSIEELQINEGLDADQILGRLGSPKELAAGYLGEKISMGGSFSLQKLKMLISFYGLASLGGMFVIPCGTVLAGGLMFCGFIAPIAGLIKAVGFLLGFEVPFVSFNFGSFQMHPLPTFPCSVIMGILLYLLGKKIWKGVTGYIRKVSAVKRTLDERV